MPELSLYSHQDVIVLPHDLLARLEAAGRMAMPRAIALERGEDAVLSDLEEVEVSLIDDQTIADVHQRFMDIPGATDVITFDHGEIHISVETAQRQSLEFGNDFERELMLYIIHGLLHLAGYEDASEADRIHMDKLQQGVLQEVW